MTGSVESQALTFACGLVGGEAALAQRLGVPVSALRDWISEDTHLPDDKLLELLDVILSLIGSQAGKD